MLHCKCINMSKQFIYFEQISPAVCLNANYIHSIVKEHDKEIFRINYKVLNPARDEYQQYIINKEFAPSDYEHIVRFIKYNTHYF